MAKRRSKTSPQARPEKKRPRRPVPKTRGPKVAPAEAANATRDTMIVGVGASAGGLEAFSTLLSALPPDAGFALVLVQHLAPQHESALPTLLGATTKLSVVQATEGMRVEPNMVYVIPPNAQMAIADDVLHLQPRPQDSSQYVPVDFLFRSLADSAQDRAIGVVLSGTASDGAIGIRDIKSVGGITIAQDPSSAKYDGMPRAAIATGMVDLVLPPEKIAAELVEIARHPYARRTAIEPTGVEVTAPLPDEFMQRVFALLRAGSGVDFRHYKLPTIQRRLQRRMVLHKIKNLEDYAQFLQEQPGEVQALHQDLLIHVTRFFREPESYQALSERIIPEMIANQSGDNPIRVWVAGCATGEEAYSVAIALLEVLGTRANAVPVQIFATDVSEHAIELARNGTYPESIAVDVSAERLRRFFSKVDGGYRISKLVRDLCIFARQDLARDPPYSKLDLIVCRNVLIYLTAALQHRLLTVFHYALKQTGYLMLGHAESVGSATELFVVDDKRHRIYKRNRVDSSLPALRFDAGRPVPTAAAKQREKAPVGHSAQHEADRIALERYAPPGVVVDEDLQIVQFRGQTGYFLEPAPGDPNTNLLKMAREGLLHGLRTAFHAARKSGAPVVKDGLKVKRNGTWSDVGLEVVPLTAGGRGHYLVLFYDSVSSPPAPSSPETPPSRAAKPGNGEGDDHVQRLEAELATSREYLQSIIQEVEAANEELQSANEEILSSNEELQSTNEELDTAKEELQSTNEELNTLNEELHGRNAELSRANSDLVNLLGSIQIAIVIVSSDLRIRRFTPMAENILNLISSDIGRPISHLKPNIDCPDLEPLITRAIDRVTPIECEVQDRGGKWYLLRVRPYKNVENAIDGAVIALFDIQMTKVQDGQLKDAQRDADGVFNAVPIPLVLLDQELQVKHANDAFCATFGYRLDGIVGRALLEIGRGAWNIPELRRVMTAAGNDGSHAEEFELTHRFPRLGAHRMTVSVRRVDGSVEGDKGLVVALNPVRAAARE